MYATEKLLFGHMKWDQILLLSCKSMCLCYTGGFNYNLYLTHIT